MKRILSNNLILAILSGLIMIPAWHGWGTGLFTLFGFVPMFFLFENLANSRSGGRKVFLFASLAYLIWTFFTVFWIRFASFAGGITAVLLTTFLMSIPTWLAFKVRQVFNMRAGLFAFVILWIAMEYVYTHGEISFPWLTLGYGFAYTHKLIQWYEITGAFGGSLWILMSNVTIFLVVKNWGRTQSGQLRMIGFTALIIVIPIIISLVRYYTYKEEINPRKIIVVQPNMDPYLKFNDITPYDHAKIQIDEAAKLMDSSVDFVVTPETSLLGNFWIGEFNKVQDVKMIRSFLRESNPNAIYIAGIVSRELFQPADSIPSTARPLSRQQGYFYNYYNTAIQVDTTDSIQMYHKSQLVTGIEKMPYSHQLRFLKKIVVNLGGTFRGNAIQKERSVLSSHGDSVRIAPVICWESVFGEYVTDYVKKGANYLFIITNDGWWSNTAGHKQHNSFASLRAIETRRSVARSANTGVSSFVNQRGDMLQTLGWWKRGALVDELNANDKITFYVKHGDYIGRLCFYSSLFIILYLISKVLMSKKTKISKE